MELDRDAEIALCAKINEAHPGCARRLTSHGHGVKVQLRNDRTGNTAEWYSMYAPVIPEPAAIIAELQKKLGIRVADTRRANRCWAAAE